MQQTPCGFFIFCFLFFLPYYNCYSPVTSKPAVQQLLHVLVVSSEGYSHCIEVFGLARLLAEDERFYVTLLSPGGSCNVLSDRMKQIASRPAALNIVQLDLSRELMSNIATTFEKKGADGIFVSNITNKRSVGSGTVLRAKFTVISEPLRRDNYSIVRQQHEILPIDVAVCDLFALGCYEYADLNSIPAIIAGVQLYPTWQDMAHNGMQLLLDRHQRSKAEENDRYPNRLNSAWIKLQYIYNQFVGQSPITYSIYDIIWNFANNYRRQFASNFTAAPVMRSFYPFIDQRVLGTLFEQRYMRPDHVLTGPSWLDLTSRSLAEEKDRSGTKSLKLVDWIEDSVARRSEPVVFVSFGSQARLNLADTRLVLEALVLKPERSSGAAAVRWNSVWKTNTTMADQILQQDQALAKLSADRLLTVDWAPQLALLNHTSVRAFVTHGGLSSVMEACATGVPLVCIPLFGDQPYNCQQIEALGNGIKLLKDEIKTPSVLRDAIQGVLTDEKIIERARLVAEYHASVDTRQKLTEFVQHYARFGYRFNHMSGDDVHEQHSWQHWREFWNVDMWFMVIGGIIIAHVAALMLLSRWL